MIEHEHDELNPYQPPRTAPSRLPIAGKPPPRWMWRSVAVQQAAANTWGILLLDTGQSAVFIFRLSCAYWLAAIVVYLVARWLRGGRLPSVVGYGIKYGFVVVFLFAYFIPYGLNLTRYGGILPDRLP